MRICAIAVAVSVLMGGCGVPAHEAPRGTTTILMAGDVSLGRGVAPVVRAAPVSVFEGLRHVIRSADVALANLESPLTDLPYAGVGGPDLTAAPAAAGLLAGAGFDLMGIANNHAADGGPGGILDTIAALRDVGVEAVGGGVNAEAAAEPAIVHSNGVAIGIVAVDATGHGPPATAAAPGVAAWTGTAERLVESLRPQVDVLIVGVHGGAEYLWHPDDTMEEIASQLAGYNVDVVWGHGAHVVQPVRLEDPDGDGRTTVVATSLGNLLFDQSRPGTDAGAVLEVVAGAGGVRAVRVGETGIEHGRARFTDWMLPAGDAVLLEGHWWSLLGADPVPAGDGARSAVAGFSAGDLIAADTGDIDGDGTDDLVASFRRPVRDAILHMLLADVQWRDASGRSAHIGVFEIDDLTPQWVASAVARPVGGLSVCDGSIVVAYTTLDDPAMTGAGGWRWTGFGWDEATDLDGPGMIGCQDLDGDGRLDPIVTGRGVPGTVVP